MSIQSTIPRERKIGKIGLILFFIFLIFQLDRKLLSDKLKNMRQATINQKQKIEIPLLEYKLLKEVYEQFRKQALLFRILEAEENFKKKRIKEEKINDFIERIT